MTPGAQVWVKRRDLGIDQASAIAVSPDGTMVYVTGTSWSDTSGTYYDYDTVAYDTSTGNRVWAKSYTGPGSRDDEATAIAVSPDGTKVFVTGYSTTSNNQQDYATVAYNASTGAQLWVRRYDGTANAEDVATAIGVSLDGTRVFVTGHSFSSLVTFNDYVTIAYDSSTGLPLWTRSYNGPRGGYDYANALVVGPVYVYVTGYVGGTNSMDDYGTVAYDISTGDQQWARQYNGPAHGEDIALAAAMSPLGIAVYVTGKSQSSSPGVYDFLTIGYDALFGTTLWAKRHDGSGSFDQPNAIAVSPTATRVFITGSSTNGDIVTIAYDAGTGSRVWLKNRDVGRYADAAALGVSPDATEVFVVGSVYVNNTNTSDYETVAYNASNGSRLWAATYNGPGSDYDFGTALAVGPNGGKIFITGSSAGPAPDYDDDYATIAYSVH
jgi:hypothetical protein